MTEVYVLKAGRTNGPYSPEEVQARLQKGIFNETDMACHDQHHEWAPLGQLLPTQKRHSPVVAPQKRRSRWVRLAMALVVVVWVANTFIDQTSPPPIAEPVKSQSGAKESDTESRGVNVVVENQEAEKPLVPVNNAPAVQDGPSDETIRLGINRFNAEWGSLPFRRGERLVAKGNRFMPEGTRTYPVKIDLDGAEVMFFLYQDSFGDWMCGYANSNITLPCKAPPPVDESLDN